ncbi:MAG: SPOR domain-containing protein [Gallionella sp.]
MRTSFWLLLLANVILFALIQRGWVWRDEPVLLAQPALNEEKIRLQDEPQSVPVAKHPALAVINPAAPHPFSSNLQLSMSISSPVAARTNARVCLEWGEFSGAELKFASAALSDLKLGNKLERRQVEQVIGYWVYIPPLGSKAAINQKVAQLKARGVVDYFIVQDAGPWRNAISLGVFKTQEAAQNFLNVMRNKDVRSARVGERSGKQKATLFILSGVGSATEARLTSMQKDFPGSELKNVPCAH